MLPPPEFYKLPSAASITCEDRFSILDIDEFEVPFWRLLQNLLTREIKNDTALIDLLETIALCRHGKLNTDYGSLKAFLIDKVGPSFYEHVWPVLTSLVLRTPMLFPGNHLPILSPRCPAIELSREQTACLVIHQFLCTLDAPPWQDGYQDFNIWYDTYQPHAGAVNAYLTTLFNYFSRLATDSDSPLQFSKEQWQVRYTLHTPTTIPSGEPSLVPLSVVYMPEQSTSAGLLGLNGGASMISANKFIGFGRTGTQEEVNVGTTPEACPAVLVTPPLEDDRVLVVKGAEAMAEIVGYGREARAVSEPKEVRRGKGLDWRSRTMLFADALELDTVVQSEDGRSFLPDVLPGHVERELKKAKLAFSSGVEISGERYNEVFTGFWGCRTFGGNPGIKTCIQWCAASRAGIGTLRFVCNGEAQHRFGRQLEAFAEKIRGMNVKVGELETQLLRMAPEQDIDSDSSLIAILEAVIKSDEMDRD